MFELAINIVSNIVKEWRTGSKGTRSIIFGASILGLLGAILLVLSGAYKDLMFRPIYSIVNAIGGISSIISVVIFFILFAKGQTEGREEQERKIEIIEKKYQDNPKEPTAAWDLARIKLEAYLDRNLKQVKSIYYLSVIVMFVGFGFIGYGVYRVFGDVNSFKPAIVAACSGIFLNFIGATFMFLFRSTMSQAKEYVSVLERINAVGMTVQILETIEPGNDNLKAKTTADVAMQLLSLYANKAKTDN